MTNRTGEESPPRPPQDQSIRDTLGFRVFRCIILHSYLLLYSRVFALTWGSRNHCWSRCETWLGGTARHQQLSGLPWEQTELATNLEYKKSEHVIAVQISIRSGMFAKRNFDCKNLSSNETTDSHQNSLITSIGTTMRGQYIEYSTVVYMTRRVVVDFDEIRSREPDP